jgi:hypothetical protein
VLDYRHIVINNFAWTVSAENMENALNTEANAPAIRNLPVLSYIFTECAHPRVLRLELKYKGNALLLAHLTSGSGLVAGVQQSVEYPAIKHSAQTTLTRGLGIDSLLA